MTAKRSCKVFIYIASIIKIRENTMDFRVNAERRNILEERTIVCRDFNRKENLEKSRLNRLAGVPGNQNYHTFGEEENHA